jgi:hypothetical protein
LTAERAEFERKEERDRVTQERKGLREEMTQASLQTLIYTQIQRRQNSFEQTVEWDPLHPKWDPFHPASSQSHGFDSDDLAKDQSDTAATDAACSSVSIKTAESTYKNVCDDLSNEESDMSTDVESVFSASDGGSSQSSLDVTGAPEEFVALLIEHENLQPLFKKASQVLDDSTFKEEFKSLLTRFARDLDKQAERGMEFLAARLVRYSRRGVTVDIWKQVYCLHPEKLNTSALDKTRLSKARKLEEVLERLNREETRDMPTDFNQQPIHENSSDTENSSDDEEGYNKLSNLRQVKEFIFHGLAFDRFCGKFEEMLELKAEATREISFQPNESKAAPPNIPGLEPQSSAQLQQAHITVMSINQGVPVGSPSAPELPEKVLHYRQSRAMK